MSYWICCNSCFHSPGSDRKLAITTCGHLICNVCFQRGTQGTCIICSSKCQVSPLSDKSSSEVKALFSDISTVANKHLKEISKVKMFQASQQKRLLKYYQQRNENLEQTVAKMKQEMQQMMKKLNEQSIHIKKLESSFQQQCANVSVVPKSHVARTPQGRQSGFVQIPFSSPMLVSTHNSPANLVESMGIGETNLFRKPSNPPRLTLTSSPLDGQMGGVACRKNNPNILANHSTSSASVSRFQITPLTPEISFSQSSGWKSPIFKPPSTFRVSSLSSLNSLRP